MLRIIMSDQAADEDVLTEEFSEYLNTIRDLYGLLHARYILTDEGMAQMREKYLTLVFGYCQRVLCEKNPVLPIGLSDDYKYARMKVYCPRCREIYKPKIKCSNMDGAFFGQSFPKAFLLVC